MIQKISIAAFPKSGISYVQSLYSAFEKENFQVVEGQFSIKWAYKNAKHIDFFHFHWPSFFYAFRQDIRKTLRNFTRFLLFLAVIRLRGGKILWTAHNLYPHDRYGLFFLDVITRVLIIRLSSAIFVHGASAKTRLIAEFPFSRKKIIEIDHGNWIGFYENTTTQNEARLKLFPNCGAYIYLFIGLCKEYKQLISLIESFKPIGGDVKLVIAGKFQNPHYLKQVQDIAASDQRISIFNQFIPDNHLQYYLNACDIVVLPYSESLTSGAAMLALSFGKPVVAPRMGSLIEMVPPSAGILYNENHPQALSEALIAARNAEFHTDDIFEHAQSFSWENTAKITYNALLGLK